MSQFFAPFPDRQFSRNASFGPFLGAGDNLAAGDNSTSKPPSKETQVFASKVADSAPSSPSKKRKFDMLSAGEEPQLEDGQAPRKKEKTENPLAKSAADHDTDVEMDKEEERGISQYLSPSFGGPGELPSLDKEPLQLPKQEEARKQSSLKTPPPKAERQFAGDPPPADGAAAGPKEPNYASPGKKRVVKQVQNGGQSARIAPVQFTPIRRDPNDRPLIKLTHRFFETFTKINVSHYKSKVLQADSREKREASLKNIRESFETLRDLLGTKDNQTGAQSRVAASPSSSSSSSSSPSPSISPVRSYTPVGFLGSGGMGRVFLAEDAATGDKVAFKVNKTVKHRYFTQQEGRILRELQGVPGVPEFRDSFKVGDTHEVVAMELLPKDVYASCISPDSSDKIQLDWLESINGLWQCLAALQACKQKKINHRDIKPDNITFNRETGIWKVADFGLAAKIDPDALNYLNPRNDVVGTLEYRPPEMVLNSHPLDFQGDIWSLACAFFEVITDIRLFDIDDADDRNEEALNLIQAILQLRGRTTAAMTRHCSKAMKDLCNGKRDGKSFKLGDDHLAKHIEKLCKKAWNNRSLSKDIKQITDLFEKMLKMNPRERITVSDAMKHPAFQSYLPAWIEIDPSWKLGDSHEFSIGHVSSSGSDGATIYQTKLVGHPKLSHHLWEQRAANDKYVIKRKDGDKLSAQEVTIPQGARIRISADAIVIVPLQG